MRYALLGNRLSDLAHRGFPLVFLYLHLHLNKIVDDCVGFSEDELGKIVVMNGQCELLLVCEL